MNINKNDLVEIYSEYLLDHEFESYAIGYIVRDFDDMVFFENINEYGFIDSFQIRFQDYISEIQVQSDYMSLVQSHINFNWAQGLTDPYDIRSRSNIFKDKSLGEILDLVMKKKYLVTVISALTDKIYTGQVYIHENNTIVISEIDTESFRRTNKTLINLEEVLGIELVSIENILISNYLFNK